MHSHTAAVAGLIAATHHHHRGVLTHSHTQEHIPHLTPGPIGKHRKTIMAHWTVHKAKRGNYTKYPSEYKWHTGSEVHFVP